jgi:N-methylhydantoinase A
MSAAWAGAGVGEIVEENMASAARVHAIERGKVPERSTLVAFGGAAPLHAARLADKLGIAQVLVPVDASVGSAVGFLRAPVAFEVVRSLAARDEDFPAGRINELLRRMQEEATAIVAAGALGARLATHRSVEMRYLGQGHEIAIALPDGALRAADASRLREAYERRYEDQFGLRIGQVPVEFLTWSVSVSTRAPAPGRPPRRSAPRAAAASASASVFDPGRGRVERIPAYRRGALGPGARLAGPALVGEPQTTTLVPRGWICQVTGHGHLLLARRHA